MSNVECMYLETNNQRSNRDLLAVAGYGGGKKSGRLRIRGIECGRTKEGAGVKRRKETHARLTCMPLKLLVHGLMTARTGVGDGRACDGRDKRKCEQTTAGKE